MNQVAQLCFLSHWTLCKKGRAIKRCIFCEQLIFKCVTFITFVSTINIWAMRTEDIREVSWKSLLSVFRESTVWISKMKTYSSSHLVCTHESIGRTIWPISSITSRWQSWVEYRQCPNTYIVRCSNFRTLIRIFSVKSIILTHWNDRSSNNTHGCSKPVSGIGDERRSQEIEHVHIFMT